MSGTSLDGIDAVLVEFESFRKFRMLASQFKPYTATLRQDINIAAQNNSKLLNNEDSPLHTLLAPVYADACETLISSSGVDKSSITGIANHGQTVKHEPSTYPPYSLQLGDAQLIANLTGLNVFSQFRQADLAVSGQGAPLMPAFHYAWLKDKLATNDSVTVLNIGGIANITQLSKQTIGFDTGPGNVLMDQWIEKHLGKRYDKNGDWAQTGTVIQSLLSKLLQDPYFSLSPPKSTGTDYFNLDYLHKHEPNIGSFAPEDVQATLLQLTVESIALEIEKKHTTGSIYMCGGGAQNTILTTQLQRRLNDFDIQTTNALGLPSDWVEAVGFAWLGYCCNNDIKSNMPSVTGAKREVVLGEKFRPKH